MNIIPKKIIHRFFKPQLEVAVIIIVLTILAACSNKSASIPAVTNEELPVNIYLSPVFTQHNFNKPLAMYQSKSLQWFVVEQGGIIKTFNSESNSFKNFLNLSTKVKFDGEMGLLGLALHPEFETNGIFFISYTGKDDVSYISRFESENLLTREQSELVILSLPQPFSNHNGGQIHFGPDGFLYIGFGDGGSAGDPLEHGQNKNSLLGTLLRININNTKTYTTPPDNPFINLAGKDEIFAYGLRNPWRWSFDKLTGDLWLADVGQNEWEEINLIQKGGNYGWNIMEGTQCYLETNCLSDDLIAPIFEYSHAEGQSVTGGYVYRGKSIPQLYGTYIYADYVSGKIWGLKKTADNIYENQLLIDSSVFISSFAEDQAGNLYVLGHQSGKIFSISESPKL